MTDDQFDELLRAWVREDFGVDLTALDEVEHGADEAAQLWRGARISGTRYAVKLSGGGTAAGLVVSAHLAQHGVPGVVGPVPTRDGRLWSQRDGRRLSVVPWISDDRALGGGMGPAHWTSYGALLAQVHATAVTDAQALLLPHEDYTHERVTSTVRSLDSWLHSAARDTDPLARALAQEWRDAADDVSTLLEQADDLGQQLRTGQAPTVICHGDPHLGNVLLGPAAQAWLIDWDDAILAPRERDLMFVIGGVLAFAPVTPQQQSWFFDGYGTRDLDPARLAYYQCTRALEDVAYPAAQVADHNRWTQSQRADALSIVQGVRSATGLINLALSSLRDLGLRPHQIPAIASPGHAEDRLR